MNLTLIRFHSSSDDTLGLLYIEKGFAGFVMEDEFREIKVMGETRIPAGVYQIAYTWSPKFKKFMLEVLNVPNFSGIRIHPGNTEADTDGCLLPGNVCRFNPNGNSRVEESTLAYTRIFGKVVSALNNAEKVTLTIKDASNV